MRSGAFLKSARVAADQAAGLRRNASAAGRQTRRSPRCITSLSAAAGSSLRLADALRRLGQSVLLADASGRLFAGASPRSLFDWKHQLERRQLQTLPQRFGDGWYAPGVSADDPALPVVASDYDQVILDRGWDGDLAVPRGAVHAVVIAIDRSGESMQRAYAVLKTLACFRHTVSVSLLGEPAACDHVLAAASRFLDPRFAQSIFNAADEDDAFAALAVRIASEETGPMAC